MADSGGLADAALSVNCNSFHINLLKNKKSYAGA